METTSKSESAERVLVTTPTGNVGRQVAARLVREGAPFAVLVREGGAGRLSDAVASHARIYEGALSDPVAMSLAGQDATSLFLALPPDPTAEDLPTLWRQFTSAAVKSITANGIRRVVLLSTQGAAPGAGALKGPLFESEEAIRQAAPDVRTLRAGGFMENLLPMAEAIAHGTLPFPAPLDLPARFVSTTDIGNLAADLLLDPAWSGHDEFGVYGPEEMTLRGIADELTRQLGHSVTPIPLSADEMYEIMVQSGISAGTAGPSADMFRGVDANFAAMDPPTARGTTPTGITKFLAQVLVPAVRAVQRP